jgi:FkbH-like protein
MPHLKAIARAPYSQLVYQRLGIAITRLVRGMLLPTKKVLAFDCDGTLWGGQIGEDGIDELVLSNDYPGRSFRMFQEMLLDLKKRGVLLVLASKNEEVDVWDVFDRHPDMVLRRADIAGYRINWKEKSSNLRELAEELILGLDSFVFIDDSPVERLEVETNAPMVTVVPIPEEPHVTPKPFQSSGVLIPPASRWKTQCEHNLWHRSNSVGNPRRTQSAFRVI